MVTTSQNSLTSPLVQASESPISVGMTELADPRSLLYRSGQLSPEEAQELARRELAVRDEQLAVHASATSTATMTTLLL